MGKPERMFMYVLAVCGVDNSSSGRVLGHYAGTRFVRRHLETHALYYSAALLLLRGAEHSIETSCTMLVLKTDAPFHYYRSQ